MRHQPGSGPSSPRDDDQGFDHDGVVEASTLGSVVTGPRWKPVLGTLIAAGLVAGLIALPRDDQSDESAPPAEEVVAPATSVAGSLVELEPEAEPLKIDEVQLLSGSDRFAPSMVLIDPTNRIEGEQAMRIINLEGRSHVVPEPVFIGAWLWPSWPGASVQPFVTAGDQIVFQSRGRIVTSSLATEEVQTIGEGMLVLDGAGADDYWIVGRDEQWVSRHSVSNPALSRRVPFGDIGRPLAAAGDGLIVDPRGDSDIEGLAMWSPERGVEGLPLDVELELLGVAGDLLVLGRPSTVSGDGTTIVTHHLGSGRSDSLELGADYDMHRAAVSPDGKRLALHQYYGLTTLGAFAIIDLQTGKTIGTIDDILTQELQWTSPETIVSLKAQAKKFQVIEVNVVTNEHTAVATLGIPWIYVAVPGR